MSSPRIASPFAVRRSTAQPRHLAEANSEGEEDAELPPQPPAASPGGADTDSDNFSPPTTTSDEDDDEQDSGRRQRSGAAEAARAATNSTSGSRNNKNNDDDDDSISLASFRDRRRATAVAEMEGASSADRGAALQRLRQKQESVRQARRAVLRRNGDDKFHTRPGSARLGPGGAAGNGDNNKRAPEEEAAWAYAGKEGARRSNCHSLRAVVRVVATDER